MKRPEIGVISHLKPDASNLRAVADFGLPCAQLCSWDKNLCGLDLARKVKRTATECGIRLTAMWGGYSGPAAWNFTRGPVTLGLVPVTYRAMRIEETMPVFQSIWFVGVEPHLVGTGWEGIGERTARRARLRRI